MRKVIVTVLVMGHLAGCAGVPESLRLVLPPDAPELQMIRKEDAERRADQPSAASETERSATAKQGALVQKGLPRPPEARSSTVAPSTPVAPAPAPSKDKVLLNLENERLPVFIQVVFGNILKRSFSVAPQVAARADLVTVRAATPQTHEQVEELARKVLRSYGVATMDLGAGVLRFVPNDAQTGMLPEIQRGRAMPETPLPMRPVFHFIEMTAVRNTDVSLWLKSIFGNRLTTVLDDPNRNAVLITGATDDVRAALQAIEVLDQPSLRGRSSIRLNPTLMSVDELARRLSDVLAAQGYVSSTTPATAAPVLLLPVASLNALFVFAVDPRMLDLVTRWTEELETRAGGGSGPNFVSYQVRNTDAQALAKVLQELLNQASGPAAQGQPAPGAAGRRVVVNPATNTLIVAGAGIDRAQVLGLMRDLDRPARAVLIEVMVAEVRLTGGLNLGVELGFTSSSSSGSIVGGTLNNLGLGSTGLVVNFFNSAGQLRARLNALATDNRARILSTPSIVARNGELASVQVGDEVPIVTSQQTTGSSQTGGTPGVVNPSVLQTIQYRNTGVILKVRPTIFSDDRVDLDVVQEVSAARQTSTGVNISPTFSQRKVETKLTLREGSTVMLAGLISSQDTRSESGIPLLKDIPLVGQAFKNDQRSTERTELVVLITPYVISDDSDARAVTDAFRGRLEGWGGAMLPLPVTGKPLAPQPAESTFDGRIRTPVNGPLPTPSPLPVPPSVPPSEAPSAVPSGVAPQLPGGPAGPTVTSTPPAPATAGAATPAPAKPLPSSPPSTQGIPPPPPGTFEVPASPGKAPSRKK